MKKSIITAKHIDISTKLKNFWDIIQSVCETMST